MLEAGTSAIFPIDLTEISEPPRRSHAPSVAPTRRSGAGAFSKLRSPSEHIIKPFLHLTCARRRLPTPGRFAGCPITNCSRKKSQQALYKRSKYVIQVFRMGMIHERG